MKDKILEIINNVSPDAVLEIEEFRGDLSIKLNPAFLLEVAMTLKSNAELAFISIRDVTAIDWAKRKNRFTVVYNVFSFKLNFRLRLKADADDNFEIDSVTPVWQGANWYERETYDMYGIKFRNHPDLRRMYMPEEFEYYPLRKEFPVMGIPGSIPLPNKED